VQVLYVHLLASITCGNDITPIMSIHRVACRSGYSTQWCKAPWQQACWHRNRKIAVSIAPSASASASAQMQSAKVSEGQSAALAGHSREAPESLLEVTVRIIYQSLLWHNCWSYRYWSCVRNTQCMLCALQVMSATALRAIAVKSARGRAAGE
jgi:hypothetical protein